MKRYGSNPSPPDSTTKPRPPPSPSRATRNASGNDLVDLIGECLARGHSVEIVKCGQYAKPGKPFLCRVSSGGFGSDDHLVYGDDARTILLKAMEHVLAHGFTQEQDRYGLGRRR